jgi:hypothetical protein
LRPSTLTGDSDDAAVIWLEIVRTPSKACSRAMSKYALTCSGRSSAPLVLTSTRHVHTF